MTIARTLILFVSHGAALSIGFALGIYALPILTAPESPSTEQVQAVSEQAAFTGVFTKDLEGSDALHWGEGEVAISASTISLMGELAPGPDYKLYLSPTFVETEADFIQAKPSMQLVGDIKTFENFLVNVPADINITGFNTVIVWCESFGQFITAARYQ
ncbi:MAG: DM13 domain-containing protein [Halioglobus sp.]